MELLVDWLRAHHVLIGCLVAGSAVTFIGTLVAVPLLVVRIPPDYFRDRRRHAAPWTAGHPLRRALMLVGRNLLGAIFVAAGIAMLVLPGQGLITILLGLILMNLPGKYRLERWVVARGPVLRSINWLRRRANRAPLVVDEGTKARRH